MLSIQDLHVAVEDKAILRGLNLEVRPGEVHAIMGAERLRQKYAFGHPGRA
ncbi:iron-sulfur cluster assembly ATPase protein SufC [Klebsiella pneumoniae]|uniref:Iron-sulfur cluster assembly ATPase protein SufC n=1 Tax=Klebsiella pneumoniae TaxID=573 RepID=A0A2X3EMS4_KLEPN|nr:iron-sulfur cluster assembly ATPase protein SufC [Klebsiella pneumoniae]SAW49838.1 iron-sulfur cluster assembly ATPase protein SufC [Klebsiella pneumoniae]SQC36317.1 iron-sulfur cluster assembly ATPase protein SufC [Klebsiella pneumoniae]VTN76908.1 iron-sulfur cluster assembly ATPase protein SufC [Klebsiella pneumoniae]